MDRHPKPTTNVRRSFSWLWPYLCALPRRWAAPRPHEVHVLLCIADHFEPGNGGASRRQAADRVARWVDQYPKLFGSFRDADNRPPRHTFFYPVEMYQENEVDSIAQLCRDGFGEVEIHLHHDNDTAANLRRALLDAKHLLSTRHGLLSRARGEGEIRYAFVHGNWALDNSRPDGRYCGVNNELDILRQTGCYGDFTLPSYPSPTQTRKVNSIYYACDNPLKPKSHDWGVEVGTAPAPADSLLMFQGPLLLDWRRRKFGVLPRVENGCIQANQSPSMARLDHWIRAGVRVRTRADWYFVKLHTHGATEANQRVLLGDSMVRFHEDLARRARQDRRFHFHYVTAREMYNLARAAAEGYAGQCDAARDFELIGEPQSPVPDKLPVTADL